MLLIGSFYGNYARHTPSHDYVGAIGSEAPFKSKGAEGVGTLGVGDPYRMVKA